MNATDAFRSLSSGLRFNSKRAQKRQRTAKDDTGPSDSASQGLSSLDGINGSVDMQKIIQATKKRNKLRTSGEDVPATWSSFTALPSLPSELLDNLFAMGVREPTPIQMQAPPVMLTGRDLLACAPTGSGKTLAFLLPLLLHAIAQKDTPRSSKRPVAVVIEPTRELARQVYTESSKIKKGTSWNVRLLGETDEQEPSASLASADQQVDLLIATPMKLVYAVKEREVDLSHVTNLVLDEADRLFELGFLPQTDEIIAACTSKELRKAMFSATIPSGVEELAKSVMGMDMIRIIIGGTDAATASISQELTYCGTEDGKLLALKNILSSGTLTPPALLFVQSVQRANDLCKELQTYGVRAESMHAERSKAERDQIVQSFADGSIWVLICTDVMSRGIDFRGVKLVINYDFPQSVQSYIHRIGRTGRAQRSGRAITFFTKDDSPFLRSIVNVMRNSGCIVPEWMLALPAPSQYAKKRLRHNPTERKDVSKSKGSRVASRRTNRHEKPVKRSSDEQDAQFTRRPSKLGSTHEKASSEESES